MRFVAIAAQEQELDFSFIQISQQASASVTADAELFGVHVPRPGTCEGIQHEPHNTEALAGKPKAVNGRLETWKKFTYFPFLTGGISFSR